MDGILVRSILLGVAAIPFIYYALVLFSTVRFFVAARSSSAGEGELFQPPISNLKPVRGLDPGAYDNFASFCRQDYPEYEILFCVGDTDDPVYPLLTRLQAEFPQANVRIIVGSGRSGTNDKVSKLARLTEEARYEHLVISDSDVRAEADYLQQVIAPLRNPRVGATTCFYVPCEEHTVVQKLQDVGMLSDFYPGILVASQLDGIKFALGPTIATTKAKLAGFGGYASIENLPADDLLVGRMIAEQGFLVELLPYTISTVPDYSSLKELYFKRLRWITVMRHMRPWGHFGLLFTLGLPWALFAVAVRPSARVAEIYIGGYFLVRLAITVLVGGWGLHQRGVWKKALLIPVWDALATAIWLVSFTRRSIRWRGMDYRIVDGKLVPTR